MASVKSPKAQQRRCLGWCGKFFWSSHEAHRRCPTCERKWRNQNFAKTCYEVPVVTREGKQ